MASRTIGKTKNPPNSRLHTLLRALGLQMFTPRFTASQKHNARAGELPKPVDQTSKAIMAARLSVHVLPICISIIALGFGKGGMFLGRSVPGVVTDPDISTALLQIVAKIQELLIFASLSTIVFTVVRSQLLSDGGIPLGMLCAGFNYSQLNYFWSEDFYAAFTSPSYKSRPKVFTTALLLVSGLIAATAGPSVATLLIPRLQEWRSGGGDFYIEGLKEKDLYPIDLTFSQSLVDAGCLGPNATDIPICPSSGFAALAVYASNIGALDKYEDLLPHNTIKGLFQGFSFIMESPIPLIPAVELYGEIRSLDCQTAIFAPYLPVAVYAHAFVRDWMRIVASKSSHKVGVSDASEGQYKNIFSANTIVEAKIPTTRVRCTEAQFVDPQLESQQLDFPVMLDQSCWSGLKPANVTLNMTAIDSGSKVHWVELPDDFGLVSTGMIYNLDHPGSPTDSMALVACSVDARWVSGSITTRRGVIGQQKLPSTSRYWQGTVVNQTSFRSEPNKTHQYIKMNQEWLQLLAPPLTFLNGTDDKSSSQTTLEALIAKSFILHQSPLLEQVPYMSWTEETVGASNRILILETLVASVFADGLSRHGLERVLQQNDTKDSARQWKVINFDKAENYDRRLLDDAEPLRAPIAALMGTNFTKFHANILISGYSYQMRSTVDYLAASILALHILLAFCHAVYTVLSGSSSAAWDSIVQLVMLAQNSTPPSGNVLQNTSAGI